MASVTVYSKEHVDGILGEAVVSAAITSGHLILTLGNGTTVDVGTVVSGVPDASDTVKGVVEIATDTETITGTDATRAVSPLSLAALTATSARRGLAQLATIAEGFTGTDTNKTVTPQVLRAIGDTKQPVFNVKAYGAVGDNFANDTSAIQQAVDACHAAGGGIVWFPAGTYKISTNPIKLYSGTSPSVVAYSDMVLAGVGSGTVISQTTTGVDVIQALNDTANGAQSKNVTIKNLRLNFAGTGTNSGHGLFLKQQAANGPAFMDWTIQNVEVYNCQGTGKYGFLFQSIITSTVERCTAIECSNGFKLDGASTGTGYSSVCTSTTFLNCYANMNANGVNGFQVLDSSYISFVGCAADFASNSAGAAYWVRGSNAVTFDGCGIELAGSNTLTYGFNIVDDGIFSSAQVVLTGCYIFQSNGTTEVRVSGSSRATVIGFHSNSQVSGNTGLAIDQNCVVTEIDCRFTDGTNTRSINSAAVWRTPGIPRIDVNPSSATPTPGAGKTDLYRVTAAAVAMTVGAPTGTPDDGQMLVIEYKDNGTARAIAHNAIYIAGPAALLTTTVVGKTVREAFQYNASAAKWVCVSSYATGW